MSFRTPGVYIREIEPSPPQPLRFSVTGFVGQAERGPLNAPQPLTRWGQFRDIFGDFVGYSFLPYAVQGFFQNGGERCVIVRVAHESATAAGATFDDHASRPALRITAINEGAWGNDLRVDITPSAERQMLLTRLTTEIQPGGTVLAVTSTAGLAPGDPVTIVHPKVPARASATITAVDHVAGTITLASPLGGSQSFPDESGLWGHGFELTVRYQPSGALVREETFSDLSLDPEHDRYVQRVVNGDPEPSDYVERMSRGLSILIRVEDLCAGATPCGRLAAAAQAALSGGDDGPRDLGSEGHRYYTGYDGGAYFRPRPPGADTATLRLIDEQLFGLAAFEAVEEIGLVAIPDLCLPDLYRAVPAQEIPEEGIIFATPKPEALGTDALREGQHAMLAHCEKLSDRLALLDAPLAARIGRGSYPIEEWPSHFQLFPSARFAALYYPWIQARSSDVGGQQLLLPPCGHVAGIYARSEGAYGVGKAPANELIQGVVSLELCLSDEEQGILNPHGINCLRALPGRGIRVWGARTLSLDPMWRYVNVRRIASAIVKSITMQLRWTVFEPNDRRLWDRIVARLTAFFMQLFQQGALAGAKPEQAFFVQCDEETNPPEVIDRGEVVTRIGFAPAQPAEFILVTIRRTAETVSASEQIL